MENVHFIPVGFDYHRLLSPLIGEKGLDVDRVHLFHSTKGVARAGKQEDVDNINRVQDMADRVEDDLQSMVDLDPSSINKHGLDDNYDSVQLLETAYSYISRELQKGSVVYINISSMPRTVAFCFALASNFFCFENPESRKYLNIYYVAPDKYLINDMIHRLEQLDSASHIVRELRDEFGENSSSTNKKDTLNQLSRLEEELEAVSSLLSTIRNYGITKGAREISGKKYVNLPLLAKPGISQMERDVLSTITGPKNFESISDIAKALAKDTTYEFNDSFRNKIQYNVESLEEKGFLYVDRSGKNYHVTPTEIGELYTKIQ